MPRGSQILLYFRRKRSYGTKRYGMMTIHPILFDFHAPWKTDLKDFMEGNYLENITISDR